MTLPATGPLTMAQVAAELGISATGLSLNDSRVRSLAGRPSGAISFADLRGKSAALPLTATLSSTTLSKSGYAPITTGTITCTAQNVSGTASYTWEYLSSNQGWQSLNCNTPYGATTSWSVSGVNAVVITETWRCKVTDTGGRTAYSPNLSITVNVWDSGLIPN